MDCAKAVRDMTGKMFIFPQATATAHVRVTPAQESFTAVTVCHRSFTDLARDHALFSLATPSVRNGNSILTYVYKNHTYSASIQDVESLFTGFDYAPNKWHSFCTTWDSRSGLVDAWVDGQPLITKYATESVIAGKPIITLGQDQDSYGGKFDANQSFVGMMTDVHMWDYVLCPCEIQKFMQEQNFTPGNVLNWAALDCEIRGKVRIANTKKICTCQNRVIDLCQSTFSTQ